MLAKGKRADLNIIDMKRLKLQAPHVARDLPSGAPRLLQNVQGYTATVVAGEVTYRNGVNTGARPGRLLRRGAH